MLTYNFRQLEMFLLSLKNYGKFMEKFQMLYMLREKECSLFDLYKDFRWCDFVMATKKCCMASHIFLDCVTVIQHDNHINANLHLVWFKILMKNVDKPYLWRSKIKSLNFCSKKNEINGQLFYLSEKVWICDKAIYFALLFCVVNNIF